MSDFTINELEKVARNIERISAFVGERRDWTVGEGGESSATEIRGSAKSLAAKLARKTNIHPNPDLKQELPSKLEPSAKISAARLSKFADFLDQLQEWFSSHRDAAMPENSNEAVQSMQGALSLMCAAVDSLLAPVVEVPQALRPDPEILGEEIDLPILEIDPNARLVLEVQELRPLTRTFQGVVELTAEAKEILNDFLTRYDIELEPLELRHFQDRMLKWIAGIPLNQVLVIKLSGLSGKPNVYSAYEPKGDIPGMDREEEV